MNDTFLISLVMTLTALLISYLGKFLMIWLWLVRPYRVMEALLTLVISSIK